MKINSSFFPLQAFVREMVGSDEYVPLSPDDFNWVSQDVIAFLNRILKGFPIEKMVFWALDAQQYSIWTACRGSTQKNVILSGYPQIATLMRLRYPGHREMYRPGGNEEKVFSNRQSFYWQRSAAAFVHRELSGAEFLSLDYIPVTTMMGSEWNAYVRSVYRENPAINFDDMEDIVDILQSNLASYSLVCERVESEDPSEILEFLQMTQAVPASRAKAESVLKAAFIPVNNDFNEALASLEFKVRENDARLQEVYDDDEELRQVISVLIPDFEYPDYAHKHLSEILAKVKRSV